MLREAWYAVALTEEVRPGPCRVTVHGQEPFLTFTPADEETTWIFGMCLRNFAHDAALMDEHHLSHTLHVLEEDQRIVESLRPRRAPFQMQDEVHVPSDGPMLRYRHMLRRALGRGPRGSGDTTSR
ncbi:hypothetical protein [Alicyclobacillus macrosporangiidus]|uniref:Vanillate O-demethylase oxygenase-like C-terminal catalytic domain-containing protein n=1 Tax=Alicyclobacillus macrosporangiidus TaxID=392015 RepID=A0A1I7J345_9BACL|nr:hypothetical protein [Alicyclobacillus macrosporangiidus]SFU79603.1 hypothetical protein SAMN05421543_10896 [Alicyclobacillus macrosporangiidus]